MQVEITQISKTPRSVTLFGRTRAGERPPRSACCARYRPYSHCIHYDRTQSDSVPFWHQMYANAERLGEPNRSIQYRAHNGRKQNLARFARPESCSYPADPT